MRPNIWHPDLKVLQPVLNLTQRMHFHVQKRAVNVTSLFLFCSFVPQCLCTNGCSRIKWHWPVMVRRERIREGQRLGSNTCPFENYRQSTLYIVLSRGCTNFSEIIIPPNWFSPFVGVQKRTRRRWRMNDRKNASCMLACALCTLHAYSVHVEYET